MDSKVCTKCGVVKPLSEYWGDSRIKNRKAAECKDCARVRKFAWYQDNKQRCNEKSRQWYKANHEHISQQGKEYRESHKDEIKGKKKLEYQQNKEKIKERSRQNYYANQEQKREYVKQYYLNNRDKVRKWARDWQQKMRKDPRFKLVANIRTAVYRSLKKRKEISFFELLEYGITDLIKHLENQFKEGMSWANYGNKKGSWSVDHIIPISAFSFQKETDTEFKQCWELSNLQPMWHIENCKKGNRDINNFNRRVI